jgi:uncharacterized OB-fold protein
MADTRTEEISSPADDESRQELLDEHLSDSSTCAECGEKVDNLRKTCPKCGHEYEESELDDTEAGNEFKAGAALDDEGKEITDEDAFDD